MGVLAKFRVERVFSITLIADCVYESGICLALVQSVSLKRDVRLIGDE